MTGRHTSHRRFQVNFFRHVVFLQTSLGNVHDLSIFSFAGARGYFNASNNIFLSFFHFLLSSVCNKTTNFKAIYVPHIQTRKHFGVYGDYTYQVSRLYLGNQLINASRPTLHLFIPSRLTTRTG